MCPFSLILVHQVCNDLFHSTLQCNPSEGTWQMIQSVLNTSDPNTTNVIAFVGGGCSTTTEPTAALSGRLYKVVQVNLCTCTVHVSTL